MSQARYWMTGLLLCVLLLAAAPPAKRASDADELRGISGVEQPPPQPAPVWWPLWLGLGVLGAASAGLLAWRYSRRPASGLLLSPDGWALQQLDDLDAQNLLSTGAAERYHTLISNVIREYLEMRFRLHAPRQTTEEFLLAMRQSPRLQTEQQDMLREFLKRCDLAKFARAGYSPDECRATGEMARSFVRQTRTAGPRGDTNCSAP